VAEAFRGLSRVDRQRRVNEILAAELQGPVHALSIRALTPEEDVPR
jgi:BolA protein